MRKTLLIFAVLLLAACSHNDGAGMQFDTNPDVGKARDRFGNLDVFVPGAVSPDSLSRRISVDRDMFMTVYLKFYDDFELAYECDGTELLDGDTFETIFAFTQDAGLLEMQSAIDEECIGSAPWTISFKIVGGASNEFDFMQCGRSINELHEIVDDMVVYLQQVAEEEMQDCNSGSYTYEEEVEE